MTDDILNKLIEPTTERLLLRQWRAEDKAPFAELNADPVVMAFFPDTLSREESDALADRCQSLIAKQGWGPWAVELSASGAFIGFVGLHIPEDELPFSPCVEIAWRLAAGYWGAGYASEAARAALRVGFEELGLAEIVSFTSVGNARSRSVMEKLGMSFKGELFEHPNVAEGSPLRQHCLYRISREQWQASRP